MAWRFQKAKSFVLSKVIVRSIACIGIVVSSRIAITKILKIGRYLGFADVSRGGYRRFGQYHHDQKPLRAIEK
jgi:hypothetical protein